MKIELNGWQKAMENLPAGILNAEIEAERKDTVTVSARDGAPGSSGASSVTTLYARVSGDVAGTACSQDLGADLSRLLEDAREAGSYAGGGTLPFHRKAELYSGHNTGAPASSPEELRRLALTLEAAVRAAEPAIVSSEVTVHEVQLSQRLVSSEGADAESASRAIVAAVSAQANFNGFACGTEFELTAASPDGFDPAAVAATAAERLRLQGPPVPFTPGAYRVFLDQPVIWNLLLTAWQMFSGPRCEAGTSCLAGKLGEPVGSPLVNLSDYPSHPACGYKYDFDFEGTPCSPIALMREGKMAGMLHHMGSAAAFGERSNGRAGRAPLLTSGIPNLYTVTPRIFLMEPGQVSRDALLAELGDGLRIIDSYDPFHCLDIASGHFSIPCRGILYKDGRPAGNVTSIAIHGSFQELLSGIEGVADDLMISPFIMTRAYCVGAPSVLVNRLMVSGK